MQRQNQKKKKPKNLHFQKKKLQLCLPSERANFYRSVRTGIQNIQQSVSKVVDRISACLLPGRTDIVICVENAKKVAFSTQITNRFCPTSCTAVPVQLYSHAAVPVQLYSHAVVQYGHTENGFLLIQGLIPIFFSVRVRQL